MTYKDYQDAILNHYEKKKADGNLSLNLQQPSPGKIRDECLFLCRSKQMRIDQSMLKSFFEVKEGEDLQLAIEQFEIDRLKPISNYLKKSTADTEFKNVELLAWLLDFSDRPLDKYKSIYTVNVNPPPDPRPPGTEETGIDTGDAPEPPTKDPIIIPPDGPYDPKAKPGYSISRFWQNIYDRLNRKGMGFRVAGIAVLGLITTIYFNNKGTAYGNVISDTSGCMIWTGNNYQQIPCDSTVRKGIVVPLDIKRMASLRRITTPDTLRIEDIENVWYKKRDRHIEYYTDGGKDPVNPNVDLHPLTEYMFNKYLRGENLSGSVKTE